MAQQNLCNSLIGNLGADKSMQPVAQGGLLHGLPHKYPLSQLDL